MRRCDYSGRDLSPLGLNLTGAIAVEANFDDANLSQITFAKSYANGASFKGANLDNAVLQGDDFTGADFTGATMRGAVISADKFDKATLTDVDFEGVIIGVEDSRRICENPTLVDYARFDVGCRD